MTEDMRSLENTLFDAFANQEWVNPQKPEQIWAICEAVRRLSEMGTYWREVKARKGHDCVRGCAIKDGDVYFVHDLGSSWDNGIKMCAGCVAMVTFYARVWERPAVFYSHWDLRANEPVLIKNKP